MRRDGDGDLKMVKDGGEGGTRRQGMPDCRQSSNVRSPEWDGPLAQSPEGNAPADP